ncbi:hypothetical protein Agub_g12884, partial [Astrephomene gubernaculifera]
MMTQNVAILLLFLLTLSCRWLLAQSDTTKQDSVAICVLTAINSNNSCGRESVSTYKGTGADRIAYCAAQESHAVNVTTLSLSLFDNCVPVASGNQSCCPLASYAAQYALEAGLSNPEVSHTALDEWEQRLSTTGGGAGLPQAAAWAVSPPQLAFLASQAASTVDLALPAAGDSRLSWADLDAGLRSTAVFSGRVIGVPYDIDPPLLFYRRDALRAVGRAVPQTWSELLATARELNTSQVSCSSSGGSTSSSSSGGGSTSSSSSGGGSTSSSSSSGGSTSSSSSSGGSLASTGNGSSSSSSTAADPSLGCYGRGFCLLLPPGCSNDGALLAAVWASMTALAGPRAGLYFEPRSMAPRFDGPAMQEAVRLYRELSQLGSPAGPCSRLDFATARSTCAMGIAGSSVVRLLGLPALDPSSSSGSGSSSGSAVWGATGTVLLPGSTVVEDPVSRQMRNCTLELCPFAELLLDNSDGGSSTPDSSSSSDGAEAGNSTLQQQQQLWVNRAPHPGRGPFYLALNPASNAATLLAAWRAVTWVVSPQAAWDRVSDPWVSASPVRYQHLAAAAVPAWVAAGWHPGDVAEYLGVLRAVLAHRNAVPAAGFLGGELLVELFGAAAAEAAAQDGPDPAVVVQALKANATAAFKQKYGGFIAIRQSYLNSIGAVLGSGELLLNTTSTSGKPRVQVSVGIAAGVVAALATLSALLALASASTKGKVLLLRGVRRRRSGAAQMPGYGPQTTLVVTDIQDSTVLWETVPEAVMDLSLDLHNHCVRQLVRRYRGYETHTEGDSFTLAFFSAADATSFALELQTALMDLDWPTQLLEHPSAAEVFLTTKAAAAAAAAASSASAQAMTHGSHPISEVSPRTTPPSQNLTALSLATAAGDAASAGYGAGLGSVLAGSETQSFLRRPSSWHTAQQPPRRAGSYALLTHITGGGGMQADRSHHGAVQKLSLAEPTAAAGGMAVPLSCQQQQQQPVAVQPGELVGGLRKRGVQSLGEAAFARMLATSGGGRSSGGAAAAEAAGAASPSSGNVSGCEGKGSVAVASGTTAEPQKPSNSLRANQGQGGDSGGGGGTGHGRKTGAHLALVNVAHRTMSSHSATSGGSPRNTESRANDGAGISFHRSASMSPANAIHPAVIGRRPSMPAMPRLRNAPSSNRHAASASPITQQQNTPQLSPSPQRQPGPALTIGGSYRRRSTLGITSAAAAANPSGVAGAGGMLTSPPAAPDWLLTGTGGVGEMLLPRGNSVIAVPSRSVSRFALAANGGNTSSPVRTWASAQPQMSPPLTFDADAHGIPNGRASVSVTANGMGTVVEPRSASVGRDSRHPLRRGCSRSFDGHMMLAAVTAAAAATPARDDRDATRGGSFTSAAGSFVSVMAKAAVRLGHGGTDADSDCHSIHGGRAAAALISQSPNITVSGEFPIVVGGLDSGADTEEESLDCDNETDGQDEGSEGPEGVVRHADRTQEEAGGDEGSKRDDDGNGGSARTHEQQQRQRQPDAPSTSSSMTATAVDMHNAHGSSISLAFRAVSSRALLRRSRIHSTEAVPQVLRMGTAAASELGAVPHEVAHSAASSPAAHGSVGSGFGGGGGTASGSIAATFVGNVLSAGHAPSAVGVAEAGVSDGGMLDLAAGLTSRAGEGAGLRGAAAAAVRIAGGSFTHAPRIGCDPLGSPFNSGDAAAGVVWQAGITPPPPHMAFQQQQQHHHQQQEQRRGEEDEQEEAAPTLPLPLPSLPAAVMMLSPAQRAMISVASGRGALLRSSLGHPVTSKTTTTMTALTSAAAAAAAAGATAATTEDAVDAGVVASASSRSLAGGPHPGGTSSRMLAHQPSGSAHGGEYFNRQPSGGMGAVTEAGGGGGGGSASLSGALRSFSRRLSGSLNSARLVLMGGGAAAASGGGGNSGHARIPIVTCAGSQVHGSDFPDICEDEEGEGGVGGVGSGSNTVFACRGSHGGGHAGAAGKGGSDRPSKERFPRRGFFKNNNKVARSFATALLYETLRAASTNALGHRIAVAHQSQRDAPDVSRQNSQAGPAPGAQSHPTSQSQSQSQSQQQPQQQQQGGCYVGSGPLTWSMRHAAAGALSATTGPISPRYSSGVQGTLSPDTSLTAALLSATAPTSAATAGPLPHNSATAAAAVRQGSDREHLPYYQQAAAATAVGPPGLSTAAGAAAAPPPARGKIPYMYSNAVYGSGRGDEQSRLPRSPSWVGPEAPGILRQRSLLLRAQHSHASFKSEPSPLRAFVPSGGQPGSPYPSPRVLVGGSGLGETAAAEPHSSPQVAGSQDGLPGQRHANKNRVHLAQQQQLRNQEQMPHQQQQQQQQQQGGGTQSFSQSRTLSQTNSRTLSQSHSHSNGNHPAVAGRALSTRGPSLRPPPPLAVATSPLLLPIGSIVGGGGAVSHTSQPAPGGLREEEAPSPTEKGPEEPEEEEAQARSTPPQPLRANPSRLWRRESWWLARGLGSQHAWAGNNSPSAGVSSSAAVSMASAACSGALSGAVSVLAASSGCSRVATGMLARLGSRRRMTSHTSGASRPEGGAGQVLLFRGLRVRVGLHSGLEPGCDVCWTKRSGRRAYSGSAMRNARLLSDAALGGMVVLSAATLQRLQPLPNEKLPAGTLVWHAGRFRLGDKDGCLSLDVYQALLPALLPRLQAFRGVPLRVVAALMPGLLEAPVGPVALAACQVVGVEVLRCWNLGVAEEALEAFRWQAAEVVAEQGGTLVDLEGGAAVAAFTRAYPAVTSLLTLEDDLKSAVPWPAPLLEHELGEEICCVLPPGPDGVVATQLVHNGLRVRCAAEWFNDVRLDLNVTRAVQLYRSTCNGKPWKQLHRMLRQAKMGQTLISGSMHRLLVSGGGDLLEYMQCEQIPTTTLTGGTGGGGGGGTLTTDGYFAAQQQQQRQQSVSVHHRHTGNGGGGGGGYLSGSGIAALLSPRSTIAGVVSGRVSGIMAAARGSGVQVELAAGQRMSEPGPLPPVDAAAAAASTAPLDRLARAELEDWGQPRGTPTLVPYGSRSGGGSAGGSGGGSVAVVPPHREGRSIVGLPAALSGGGGGWGATSTHGCGTSTSAANSSNPSDGSDVEHWGLRSRGLSAAASVTPYDTSMTAATGSATQSPRGASLLGMGSATTASRSRLAMPSREPSTATAPGVTEAGTTAAVPAPADEATVAMSGLLSTVTVAAADVDGRSSAADFSSFPLAKLAAAGVSGMSNVMTASREMEFELSSRASAQSGDPRVSAGTYRTSRPHSYRLSTGDVSSRMDSVLVPQDRVMFNSTTSQYDPISGGGGGVVLSTGAAAASAAAASSSSAAPTAAATITHAAAAASPGPRATSLASTVYGSAPTSSAFAGLAAGGGGSPGGVGGGSSSSPSQLPTGFHAARRRSSASNLGPRSNQGSPHGGVTPAAGGGGGATTPPSLSPSSTPSPHGHHVGQQQQQQQHYLQQQHHSTHHNQTLRSQPSWFQRRSIASAAFTPHSPITQQQQQHPHSYQRLSNNTSRNLNSNQQQQQQQQQQRSLHHQRSEPLSFPRFQLSAPHPPLPPLPPRLQPSASATLAELPPPPSSPAAIAAALGASAAAVASPNSEKPTFPSPSRPMGHSMTPSDPADASVAADDGIVEGSGRLLLASADVPLGDQEEDGSEGTTIRTGLVTAMPSLRRAGSLSSLPSETHSQSQSQRLRLSPAERSPEIVPAPASEPLLPSSPQLRLQPDQQLPEQQPQQPGSPAAALHHSNSSHAIAPSSARQMLLPRNLQHHRRFLSSSSNALQNLQQQREQQQQQERMQAAQSSGTVAPYTPRSPSPNQLFGSSLAKRAAVLPEGCDPRVGELSRGAVLPPTDGGTQVVWRMAPPAVRARRNNGGLAGGVMLGGYVMPPPPWLLAAGDRSTSRRGHDGSAHSQRHPQHPHQQYPLHYPQHPQQHTDQPQLASKQVGGGTLRTLPRWPPQQLPSPLPQQPRWQQLQQPQQQHHPQQQLHPQALGQGQEQGQEQGPRQAAMQQPPAPSGLNRMRSVSASSFLPAPSPQSQSHPPPQPHPQSQPDHQYQSQQQQQHQQSSALPDLLDPGFSTSNLAEARASGTDRD